MTNKYQPIPELLHCKHSNANKLKGVIGCSYETAWRKMKNPKLFTVADLLNIEACGVATLDELLVAIKEMRR